MLEDSLNRRSDRVLKKREQSLYKITLKYKRFLRININGNKLKVFSAVHPSVTFLKLKKLCDILRELVKALSVCKLFNGSLGYKTSYFNYTR